MMKARALAWSLVLAPAAALFLYAGVYGVNGAEWDHLAAAVVFDRWDRGDFTPAFLFSQHNEHRIAAPRLAVLALGELTRWNNRVEVYVHAVLMCTAAVILFAAFRRDARIAGARERALLFFAPIACLLVSPRSYQALFGDGFPHYLSIVGFAGAYSLLHFRLKAEATQGADAEATPPRAPWLPPSGGSYIMLFGATAFGLLASFSIANGLLVWPVGLLILLCASRIEAHGISWPSVAIWTAAGAATIAGYFYGYVDPGNQTSPWLVLQRPHIAAGHYLTLQGSALAPEPSGALVFGAAVLILDVLVLWRVFADWRRRRMRPPAGTWLIVTVLVSTAMITLNRMGFGIIQALDSRYTALTVLAPVGVYWCLVARRESWRRADLTIASTATLLVIGYFAASVEAWTIAPAMHSRRAWQAYLLYSAKYQPPELLRQLYADAGDARTYSAMIERLGYSVFAEARVRPGELTLNAPQPEFIVDEVNGRRADASMPIDVRADEAVVITGWAMNGRSDGPARAAFLTIDGVRDLPAHVGTYRPRLCGAIERRGRCWSGLYGSFSASLLDPGEHTVAMKIVDDEGRRAFVSEPIARIIRR